MEIGRIKNRKNVIEIFANEFYELKKLADLHHMDKTTTDCYLNKIAELNKLAYMLGIWEEVHKEVDEL